jgi:hypothetical protein
MPLPPSGLSRAKRYAFHMALATGVTASAATCGGVITTDAGAPIDAAGNETAAKDASADQGLTFGDSQPADQAAPKDVTIDFISPPPPYGCVFPEGCGDVKV